LDQKPNLLFIDDDALTLQLMQRIAGFLGYQAATCTSPEAALQWMREFHPDLVLVDLQMEDMNGLAFVRHIRQIPEIGDIPVIILSAGESYQDKERASQAGANGYINKPLSLESLEKAVKQFVKKGTG
jgi:two-component system cell cycle response regulator DivK